MATKPTPGGSLVANLFGRLGGSANSDPGGFTVPVLPAGSDGSRGGTDRPLGQRLLDLLRNETNGNQQVEFLIAAYGNVVLGIEEGELRSNLVRLKTAVEGLLAE